MKCKRCGKAIGTDRGICPFCGAMLTKEQMTMFNELKKEQKGKPELLTEKYGEKNVYYESRNQDNSVYLLWIVLGILLFLVIILFVISMIF